MSCSTSLTFVSSFLDIYTNVNPERSREWRFDRFREVAETGINICIYVSIENMMLISECIRDFPNVKLMKIVTVEDSWVSQICEQYDDLRMPEYRNHEKDTREYILLMNAKIEYLYHTIKANPFNTTHFAWIDFNISYIFKDIKNMQCKFTQLSKCQTFAKTFIAFPGCYNNMLVVDETIHVVENIFDAPYWRFCGGFFMGDKTSILHMHELYKLHFPAFIFKYKRLVWEINFWAWLEAATAYKNDIWEPMWYESYHCDTIIDIPIECYITNIMSLKSSVLVEYEYPSMVGFVPTSACYLKTSDGVRILNTRYVNYTIDQYGVYVFINESTGTIIESKNLACELNDEFMPCIRNSTEMWSSMIEPIENTSLSKQTNIYGLEDIRIFEDNDNSGCVKIKFLATSYNYSDNEYGKIVMGEYDFRTRKVSSLSNRKVVDAHKFSRCEKNWITIADEKGPARFIYQWCPLIIGHIEERTSTDIFVPDYTFDTSITGVNNIRGSSPMIDVGEVYLGVVHFSRNIDGLKYYHMLISLNKETLAPHRFSAPFVFENMGIEFCIGFTIEAKTYRFWISRNDCDPAMISVSESDIPLRYSF